MGIKLEKKWCYSLRVNSLLGFHNSVSWIIYDYLIFAPVFHDFLEEWERTFHRFTYPFPWWIWRCITVTQRLVDISLKSLLYFQKHVIINLKHVIHIGRSYKFLYEINSWQENIDMNSVNLNIWHQKLRKCGWWLKSYITGTGDSPFLWCYLVSPNFFYWHIQ